MRRPDPRGAVAAAGLAAVGLAAALLVAPGALTTLLPVETLARETPLARRGGRALAVAVAGGGCLLWVVWAGAWAAEGTDGRRTPREERREEWAFDRRLRRAVDAGERDREEVREALRSLAVDVVARTDGCSRERALERVDRGEWTDDPVAAAYVAADVGAPPGRRLRAWIWPRATTVRRVERTVAALEGRLDGGGGR